MNVKLPSDWFEAKPFGAMSDFIALEDRYRTDSLIVALREAIEQLADTEGRDLTPQETTLVTVDTFENAVNSGGFAEFISYSPELTPLIIGALTEIGASNTAEIVTKNLDVPGVRKALRGFAKDSAEDVELSDTAMNALERFDEIYQKSGTTLSDKLWIYVKENRDAFKLPEIAISPPKKQRGFFAWLFKRD